MRKLSNLTAMAMLAALSGCNNPPAESKPSLHEVMTGTIDPVADVIWETSNKSYGDDGKAQVGILTDQDWLAIQQAARKLHDGAQVIVKDPAIVAVRPGVKILDEEVVAEAVTAAQVASYIERDRSGLAREARALSTIALAIEAAAKARNAHETVRLAEQLDDVCEGCHKRFWYPEGQK